MLTPVWPDRDDFIHVNQENIEEKMKPNFEKRPFGDAEFGVKGSVNTGHSPYDVYSAQKFWETCVQLIFFISRIQLLSLTSHIFPKEYASNGRVQKKIQKVSSTICLSYDQPLLV